MLIYEAVIVKMIAAIFILQASKIRGEREFAMKTAMNTNINTNTQYDGSVSMNEHYQFQESYPRHQ